MPELPDLVHIVRELAPAVRGRIILSAELREPVVLRILMRGEFARLLAGRTILDVMRHGPFLRWSLSGTEGSPEGLDLVMHLMLAGRLRLAEPGEKALPATAFSLHFDDGRILHYGDDKKMGKVYLCPRDSFSAIPGYLSQGVDVTGPDFTFELFSGLIEKKRCQARVFVMDQSLLSAIGNAYADEILFEAGIHPKATCSTLSADERQALYAAIRSVLAWGVEEVDRAGRPLEDKVRDHMRVRGRAGQPCPRCGTTIRRAGVLGYDAFFCPRCQPDRAGKGFVDWTSLPPAPPQL
ncbi:MAG TPA: DNA-formamidopyrimidine glycosylase family protein [Rectinemataceae bacterium]|nr:DNA-formamidopyrimidine glycosylase family protein [Rectinemataceae bacterium]